jgi:hypothetical protein
VNKVKLAGAPFGALFLFGTGEGSASFLKKEAKNFF